MSEKENPISQLDKDTSLQTAPPSLPSTDEWVDAILVEGKHRDSVKAYLRFWKLAWQEFILTSWFRWMNASKKLAALILAVTGLAVGSIAIWLWPLLPPLAWLSIGLGLMLITQVFAFHFLGRSHERTTRELGEGFKEKFSKLEKGFSKQLAGERETAETDRDSLVSRLAELEKRWLKLELDTNLSVSETGHLRRSHVQIYGNNYLDNAAPTEYPMWARLIVRLDNPSIEPTMTRDVNVSLWKKTEQGQEVRLGRMGLTVQLVAEGVTLGRLHDVPVKANERSSYQWLLCYYNLSPAEYADESLFVRVSMTAPRQPTLELDVDWDKEEVRKETLSGVWVRRQEYVV